MEQLGSPFPHSLPHWENQEVEKHKTQFIQYNPKAHLQARTMLLLFINSHIH